MDPATLVEMEFRVSHRHNDGSSWPMVEVQSHHDSAAHDPERQWPWRRIYRCTSCEETITIEPGALDEDTEPRRP
jgi:hypothetical protein